MRFKIAAVAAAVAVAFAVPAQAEDQGTRVEARGGVFFGHGIEEATAGAAIGHDFNVSDSVFIGAEASLDKILDGAFNRTSLGLTGRIGSDFGPARAYALGGYQTEPCNGCVSSYTAGAGLEYPVTETIYLKGEYRHLFANHSAPDFDAVLVGVGVVLR